MACEAAPRPRHPQILPDLQTDVNPYCVAPDPSGLLSLTHVCLRAGGCSLFPLRVTDSCAPSIPGRRVSTLEGISVTCVPEGEPMTPPSAVRTLGNYCGLVPDPQGAAGSVGPGPSVPPLCVPRTGQPGSEGAATRLWARGAGQGLWLVGIVDAAPRAALGVIQIPAPRSPSVRPHLAFTSLSGRLCVLVDAVPAGLLLPLPWRASPS